MSASAPRLTPSELLYRVLRLSGFCYLLRKALWRNRAAVLYYHDPKPDVMEAHLQYLSKVSKIVALPDLWRSISTTPLAAITIDDGMIGNLALKEVFQKHGVRPMLYLCTGIARAGAGYWWLSLGDRQVKAEDLKLLDNRDRKKILSDLGFDQFQPAVPRQAMAEELRSVLDWADLGAHTRFHPVLVKCDDEECWEEISLSRRELIPLLGAELDQFAYPNGDYSEREVAFVKQAGFASARTCDPGWNDAGSDRFRLKGIYIDDDASIDKFAVQLTGVPALTRRLIARLRGALLGG